MMDLRRCPALSAQIERVLNQSAGLADGAVARRPAGLGIELCHSHISGLAGPLDATSVRLATPTGVTRRHEEISTLLWNVVVKFNWKNAALPSAILQTPDPSIRVGAQRSRTGIGRLDAIVRDVKELIVEQ